MATSRKRCSPVRALGAMLAAVVLAAAGPGPAAHADYTAGAAAFSRGDWAGALREWRPLADAGDARAQNNLGFMYRYGRGVRRDEAEAVRWYRRAAEQGLASAQFNLGLMYDNGLGVAQDFTVAAGWFRRAAGQGAPRAQAFLGMMYWTGKGVPRDRQQALAWTLLAAETGLDIAVANRRRFSGSLSPAEIRTARLLAEQTRLRISR